MVEFQYRVSKKIQRLAIFRLLFLIGIGFMIGCIYKFSPRYSYNEESSSEDIKNDVGVDEITSNNDKIWDNPSTPSLSLSFPDVEVLPLTEAPIPIGGYQIILTKANYPGIAVTTSLEDTVVVQAFIDKYGKVAKTTVLSSNPNEGLNKAAIESIRTARFKPAKQRDKPVGVWISIPIYFKIYQIDIKSEQWLK